MGASSLSSTFLPFPRTVSLDIKMKLETKAVYNVIGTINGKDEPGKTTVTNFVISFS